MRYPSFLRVVLGGAVLLAATGTARAHLTEPLAALQGVRWKVGEALPPLRLPTVDGGTTLDLRRTLGKKLLLLEFASW